MMLERGYDKKKWYGGGSSSGWQLLGWKHGSAACKTRQGKGLASLSQREEPKSKGQSKGKDKGKGKGAGQEEQEDETRSWKSKAWKRRSRRKKEKGYWKEQDQEIHYVEETRRRKAGEVDPAQMARSVAGQIAARFCEIISLMDGEQDREGRGRE